MNAIIHHGTSLSITAYHTGVSIEEAGAAWWAGCDKTPEAAVFLAQAIAYAKSIH